MEMPVQNMELDDVQKLRLKILEMKLLHFLIVNRKISYLHQVDQKQIIL